MKKRDLFATIAFSTIVVLKTASASAQTTAPATASAERENDESEIVVTAERRAANPVDVPIALVAASPRDLANAGVTNVRELEQIVPGLRMNATGEQAQPSIRGVGALVASPGASANVAQYLDGFYQPSASIANLDLSDIESVQVLKGPQGTLYGRNATGGAILISTRNPAFEATADVSASYASFNYFKATAFATAPLVADKLAASVSLLYDHGNGYIKNITTGKSGNTRESKAIRGKLLWKPSENISFLLGGSYADVDDPTPYASSIYKGRTLAALFPGAVFSSKANRTAVPASAMPRARFKIKNVNLTATVDMNFATLTSYTSGQWVKGDVGYAFDGSSQAGISIPDDTYFPLRNKTYQQEFDLTSNGDGKLKWTLGAFFFRYDFTQDIGIGLPPKIASPLVNGNVDTRAIAFFGEATYEILPKLFLTGGVRYSKDKATQKFIFYTPALFVGPPIKAKFSRTTKRAVLRYQLDEDQSIYASYSEGFKPGIFNVLGGQVEPADSENIKAYEIGYKGRLGRLRLDTAAFYYDYTDLQVNTYDTIAGIAVPVVLNAGGAEIYGAEASLRYDVTNDLTASVGVAYVHSKYTDFNPAPRYLFSPTTAITVVPDNATGNKVVGSPELAATVALNYRRTMSYGIIGLNANLAYQSSVNFDPFGDTRQGRYAVLNLRASWDSPDRSWGIAVFGRNVTDTKYLWKVNSYAAGINAIYGPPATVGVEVKYHF